MKENAQIPNQEFVPKHYSIISDIIYFIRYFKEYEPVVLFFSMLEIILSAIVPLTGIYLPKIAIDLITRKASIQEAVVILVLFTVLMAAVCTLKTAVAAGKYNYYNAQRDHFIGLLFIKKLKIPYKYTESGDMKKVYWKAYDALCSGDWSALSRMVTGTVGISINILCFLLYSTVIGTLDLWLLLVIDALAFASYAMNLCQIHYEESFRDEFAETNKKYYCILNSMEHPKSAKDIRIFGMKHWLVQLRDIVIEQQRGINQKIFRKRSFYEKAGFLLSMGRDLGAYAFLLYQALEGIIDAGGFVLYFGAISGFSGFITGIMNSLAELRSAANSADYLRAYMELPEEDTSSGNRHVSGLEFPLCIEFRDVSFAYQDAAEDIEDNGDMDNSHEVKKEKKKIFDHLNIRINAGEKIALVGVNGAGKTTFVKLLCGMYEPDSGQILINGIDRNEFPKKELYGLFSAIFQEQLIFPFTLGENIAMDRAENINEKRAWDAIDRAGLKEVFEEKNIDLKTYMTRYIMKSGANLSGGQQQRLLLARALYKDSPVLVLDEPTAALDPIAESEVYNSYNKYSQGKTALFISHRLASTRFSDRIIMLEDGKIIEEGSHNDLMQLNGKYAEMFHIQSNYYDEGEKG
ncbi:MAG: ABC transporter ATP-binding protein [Lachnospiraceae bacterium]|nr:ABC transporter ATP-binding protein [Lachnospiraceae bacterium]